MWYHAAILRIGLNHHNGNGHVRTAVDQVPMGHHSPVLVHLWRPTKKILNRLPTANSWWRHQMETFSASLTFCAGNSPIPVNSPHNGQWRGALMFSLICAWITIWVNNREAGDLRRHRGHYDVNVMKKKKTTQFPKKFFQCYSSYHAVIFLERTHGRHL